MVINVKFKVSKDKFNILVDFCMKGYKGKELTALHYLHGMHTRKQLIYVVEYKYLWCISIVLIKSAN